MLHERTRRTNSHPHAPLSDADVQKIVHAIFQLMHETGVKFDPVAKVMDLLSDAGCDVSVKGIVKFPIDLVRGSIESVAKSVRIWNRPGTDFIELSPAHSVFLVGLSAPNIVDIDTGERRPCTKEDLATISRVTDALSDIDGLEAWFNQSEVDRFLAIVANSTKPQCAIFGDPIALRAAIEMAAVIRGGMVQLEKKPFLCVTVSGMPLYYSTNDLDQVLILAENNIPMGVATMGIGGASTPITVAGNVVNCFASDFAGLVLGQLLRKGSFCMVGSTIGFMDPTSGNIGGQNEFHLAEMVKCQIGRYLGLPLGSGNAGTSAGKDFDQETVSNISATMMAGIFSQATCCTNIGGIDALQAFSLHALLLCNEFIGTARRMWKGVRVDDETLALDVTRKVGPARDYLAEMHTAVHCRKEISPIKYFASKTFESWEQGGRKDLKDIIDQDLRRILATHTPEPLPALVQDKLNDILREYAP